MSKIVPSKQPLPRFTHKGWFCFIAPIYIADPHSAAPYIHERHWSVLPLFILAELLFRIYAEISLAIAPDRDVLFPVLITGKLK